jgi:putative redox protein
VRNHGLRDNESSRPDQDKNGGDGQSQHGREYTLRMSESSGPGPTPHASPIQVQWAGGLQFDAGRPGGPMVRIDADAKSGPGPFDMLLASIAACAATDVVEIMRKQRTPLSAMSVRVDAHRVNETPRRLASAVLHFHLAGSGITAEKAERAVELSVTKYCSVRSSLLPEASVTWTIEIEPVQSR